MSRNYFNHPEMFDAYFAGESLPIRRQHEEIVAKKSKGERSNAIANHEVLRIQSFTGKVTGHIASNRGTCRKTGC
jgi:hypothetical protein